MSTVVAEHIYRFSHLFESSLLAEMEEKSMLMSVSSGESMLKIGQPVWAVPLVISGTIRVSRMNDEGQELMLYYVKECESCAMTFTCWMTAQVSSINGVTEEDTVLLCIPVGVVDEWMKKYTSWSRFVMNTILDGFTEVIKSIDDIAFKKTDERLIQYLKEKSKITSSTLINLTHQQIANELGANRVVVSRLLKKLETDHRVLLYRNQIKLLRDL